MFSKQKCKFIGPQNREALFLDLVQIWLRLCMIKLWPAFVDGTVNSLYRMHPDKLPRTYHSCIPFPGLEEFVCVLKAIDRETFGAIYSRFMALFISDEQPNLV